MPPEITSPQNPRVKELARLRDARGRHRAGRFVIDGARELARAIASNFDLVEAYICPELCESSESREVLQALAARSIPTVRVSRAVFEKIAFGQRAEGVLAVANTPDCGLDRISLGPRAVIAVLVGVEKPGNVGAVLRSADAAGIAAVVVADSGTDLFNPNCIRASLGTIFQVPFATGTSPEVLAWLRRADVPIFAAQPEATLPYSDARLAGPAAIVLGSEATGLPDVWRTPGVTGIRLPMLGIADSLNVSVTAGVLFYEALRQRGLAIPIPADKSETR